MTAPIYQKCRVSYSFAIYTKDCVAYAKNVSIIVGRSVNYEHFLHTKFCLVKEVSTIRAEFRIRYFLVRRSLFAVEDHKFTARHFSLGHIGEVLAVGAENRIIHIAEIWPASAVNYKELVVPVLSLVCDMLTVLTEQDKCTATWTIPRACLTIYEKRDLTLFACQVSQALTIWTECHVGNVIDRRACNSVKCKTMFSIRFVLDIRDMTEIRASNGRDRLGETDFADPCFLRFESLDCCQCC